MEKKPSVKLASLLLLLATMTCMALWRMPVAEARGELQCPRMIDCSSVCQGYPWRCVDGKCICDKNPPQAKVKATMD
ncbi:hypothetical protein RchiOBHm_Chr4g0437001 [Rosa chinensis]|uniref:Late nodulin n=1 Tax=Rosa chinensis TaxID=74649 RepID=A0A2P6R294_ROSCH|nr:hypothetical protein RchiOBHm_Chr4g0437001 [Rosa chinensis]